MSFILFILLFAFKFLMSFLKKKKVLDELFISKERNPRLGTYVVTGPNLATTILLIIS